MAYNDPYASSSLHFRRRARYDMTMKRPSLLLNSKFDCSDYMQSIEHYSLDTLHSRYLLTGSREGICIFDVDAEESSKKCIGFGRMPDAFRHKPIRSLSWLPSDNGIAITTQRHDGLLHIWDISTLQIADSLSVNCLINDHCINNSPHLSSSARFTVAISHERGVKLVDLRSGMSIQSIPLPKSSSNSLAVPLGLSWDPLISFHLYCGHLDGSISRFDIRKPRGGPIEIFTGPLVPVDANRNESNQLHSLHWHSPDALISLTGSGLISLITPSTGTLQWRSDIGVEPFHGYQPALICDTDPAIILLPVEGGILALDAFNGSVRWLKQIDRESDQNTDLQLDSLLYNPHRMELYASRFGDGNIFHISLF